MKKLLLAFFLLLAVLLICACANNENAVSDTLPVIEDQLDKPLTSGSYSVLDIKSIYDYNTTSEIDSHKGKTQYSHLEMSYRDLVVLDSSITSTNEVWYPRVKQTATGEYILLYMNGEVGHDIYITRSKDLRRWQGSEKLFASGKSKKRMYASADAIVLNNGDIIAAAGFRWEYSGDQLTNGIEIRRSTDNGATWSAPQVIYTGAVWEPSLLQLPSGEVQIYWTNTHVKGASPENFGRTDDNSTGTAMLRSFDNGYTWNGNINVPYTAQIVAQQYTKTGSDGKYYSGQMPVATILNNGKIALALEVRTTDSSGNKTYNLSFAYTDAKNSWPVALGGDEEGPELLKKNMFLKGAGPYIRQFKSGETLLTYHWDSWYMLIGNTDATQFNERVKAFGKDKAVDIWGSTEIIGTHTVIGTVPDASCGGIYVSKFNLNHTVKAKNVEITVDGNTSDWESTDEAFFVGSESQAQTAIRVAQDDEYIYFVAEVLDNKLSQKDRVSFCVGNVSSGKYVQVSVNPLGDIGINPKGGLPLSKDDVSAFVLYDGTVDDFKDKDNGYIVELRIPKSVIGAHISEVIFNPVLQSADSKEGKVVSDSVSELSATDRTNWLRIEL